MEYLLFSVWFTVIHTAVYTAAGAVALKLSKDLYEEKNRLLDYLNDMSVEMENKHVAKWFLPAQLLRGLLMSVVLYPVLGLLGGAHFWAPVCLSGRTDVCLHRLGKRRSVS